MTYPYWFFFPSFFLDFPLTHQNTISEKKIQVLKMSFRLCKLECVCSEKASEIWGSGFQKREGRTPVLFCSFRGYCFLNLKMLYFTGAPPADWNLTPSYLINLGKANGKCRTLWEILSYDNCFHNKYRNKRKLIWKFF